MNQKEPKITNHCKDLIKRMLDKDPNKRITISEIMLHPWISKYKEQKIRREWGYSDSESDSLILEDEDIQGQDLSNNNDHNKTESTKINSSNMSSNPLAGDQNIRDFDMIPLPEHLLRTHQK